MHDGLSLLESSGFSVLKVTTTLVRVSRRFGNFSSNVASSENETGNEGREKKRYEALTRYGQRVVLDFEHPE